ncbi:MAG TPA: TetR family transcriptional regulator C-terminal domain-containing protein, partial [Sandaracinaceae bacterium]
AFPFPGHVRAHQVLEACMRSPVLHAKYLELLARARDRLTETIRRGQRACSIRSDVDPEAVAQMLLAMVLGVEVATELQAPYDADRVAEDVLRMLAPSRARSKRATERPGPTEARSGGRAVGASRKKKPRSRRSET